MMSYKKHFSETFNINPKAIVGFVPKDGNHKNYSLDNMMLIVDTDLM